MKYTINSIQGKCVNVSFLLDDETLAVILNGLPTHDAGALERALSDYAHEYIASKPVAVDPAIVAGVGVQKEVLPASGEEVQGGEANLSMSD